jgi:hypothetical protein
MRSVAWPAARSPELRLAVGLGFERAAPDHFFPTRLERDREGRRPAHAVGAPFHRRLVAPRVRPDLRAPAAHAGAGFDNAHHCGGNVVEIELAIGIAGLVCDLDVRSESRAESLQRCDLVEGLHAGAAAAGRLAARGVLADDQHPPYASGIERQEPALVFQQHDRLDGGVVGRLLVLRRVQRAGGTPGVPGAHAFHHRQHAAGLVVHHGFRHAAVAQRREEWTCEVALFENPGRMAHLDVEAVARGFHRVVRAAPVADDEAIEAPLRLQDLDEQPAVVTAVLSAVSVIGAHDGEAAPAPDGRLEGGQVDFAQRAVIHHDIDLAAIQLLVVQGEMLDARGGAGGLDTLDDGHGHFGGEVGILAEILEVASAQRGAEDIAAGAEDHVLAPRPRLCAQGRPVAACQVRVPGRREGGAGGQAGGRVVVAPGGTPALASEFLADAVRAVGHPELRDAKAFDRRQGKQRCPVAEADFLFERHRPKQCLDAFRSRTVISGYVHNPPCMFCAWARAPRPDPILRKKRRTIKQHGQSGVKPPHSKR